MDGREELNHGKKSLSSTSTYFEATDLQQHVEYQFWVTGSTRVGEGQSSKVAAQVPTNRVPARITSFGGHVVRPWRGSATLACNAVGDPTREWYKGTTEPIRTDSARNLQILQTGELVLSNLQSQDSGNYTCQVENSQGSDKLHYTLTVQGNSCLRFFFFSLFLVDFSLPLFRHPLQLYPVIILKLTLSLFPSLREG